VTQFEKMEISSSILQAINEMGLEAPTAIQSEAIPEILNGKDLLCQAKTGTVLTFGVPMIQKADTEIRGIHGLVLTPTPEICIQVAEELSRLVKHNPQIRIVAVYGGQPIDKQIAELREVPHIVVGTPARLLEHLDRGTIRLYHIRTSVLDHTDTMLDMGFQDEVESILDQIPSGRQMLIFSETMPTKVISLANSYLKSPLEIDIQPIEDAPVVVQKETVRTETDEADEKIEAVIKTIKATIEEGGLGTYTEMLDQISDILNPRIVAAALLKLHLGQRQAPPLTQAAKPLAPNALAFSREDLEQASIRPGKIRLMLNVGRRDGVSVKEVLELFATETGLTSYFLGDIVLGDTATYVDVPEDKIPAVFTGLNGIVHNETPLAIRLIHKVRDAAQLQRDMAEQRSRRPDKRFDGGGDRRPQNNRRSPGNQNQQQRSPRPPRQETERANVVTESSESTPVASRPERRQDSSQDRDRKPRDKYSQGRSDNYRKSTSALPPYFPASSSSMGTPRGLDS